MKLTGKAAETARTAGPRLATEKQIAYVTALRDHSTDLELVREVNRRLPGLTHDDCQDLIPRLQGTVEVHYNPSHFDHDWGDYEPDWVYGGWK